MAEATMAEAAAVELGAEEPEGAVGAAAVEAAVELVGAGEAEAEVVVVQGEAAGRSGIAPWTC